MHKHKDDQIEDVKQHELDVWSYKVRYEVIHHQSQKDLEQKLHKEENYGPFR